MRIAITGYPKAGKSTLAAQLAKQSGAKVLHTDDLIGSHDWPALSEAVSHWFDAPGDWIIEGVAVPRALRKWSARNPGKSAPVDKYVYLDHVTPRLSTAQLAMGKGIVSVHRSIAPWLGKRITVSGR